MKLHTHGPVVALAVDRRVADAMARPWSRSRDRWRREEALRDLALAVAEETYDLAGDEFRFRVRKAAAEQAELARLAAEEKTIHDAEVPAAVPARGTRTLIEQLITLAEELVAKKGYTDYYRRGADSFARRVRVADRAEVARQLQRCGSCATRWWSG